MRIMDWISDVCSSYLRREPAAGLGDGEHLHVLREHAGVDEPLRLLGGGERDAGHCRVPALPRPASPPARWPVGMVLAKDGRHPRQAARHRERSDAQTSELQSLMRNSYAVLCLKKKTNM